LAVIATLTKDAAGYYLQASESGGEPPGRWWGPGAKAIGHRAADIYARLPAAEPHATAERRHELRAEDARCYVSRPASVSCTLPPFHWAVTSLAGLSWSREKRCSRPWWRASTRSVLSPAISADPCVE